MSEWTFGIITDGSQPNRVLTIIDSIHKEKIPEYEIIIVGGECPLELNPDTKNRLSGGALTKDNEEFVYQHIPFDESIKKAWITRKKNLIAQHALFNNLCIMHDYVALEPGWYQGCEEFGYDWYTCMHRVLNKDGARYRDWCMISNDAWMRPPIDKTQPPREFAGRFLDYNNNTWGRWQYYSGAYFCVKRDVLLEVPLDEARVASEGEDVQWSRLLYYRYGQQAFTMNDKTAVRFLKYKDPVPWQHLPVITGVYPYVH